MVSDRKERLIYLKKTDKLKLGAEKSVFGKDCE
jgi:hypothetical protein